jgi:hypothetical protein
MVIIQFCFCFSVGLRHCIQGFTLAKQVLYHFSHTSSPFCSGYFGDGISWNICQCWPQTSILPISASQIARITGMSHCTQRSSYGFFDQVLTKAYCLHCRTMLTPPTTDSFVVLALEYCIWGRKVYNMTVYFQKAKAITLFLVLLKGNQDVYTNQRI